MTTSNTDLILAKIAELKIDMKADTDAIKAHLEQLNGRTRKVESGIAVHWVLWCILGATLSALAPFVIGTLL